ncbi:MAG: diguanylate cyclase [Candidatus Uhrbacteria bacterium]
MSSKNTVKYLERLVLRLQDELAQREEELARVTAERNSYIDKTEELSEDNERLASVNETLTELAGTDDLTGLRNRRSYYEDLERETQLVDRTTGRHDRVSGECRDSGEFSTTSLDDSQEIVDKMTGPDKQLTVVYLDLENFKGPNDLYGEGFGDRLLTAAAQLIQGECRGSDLAYRIGGDEFTLILRQCGSKDAQLVINRIRKAADAFRFDTPDGGQIGIKFYFGAASRNGNVTAEDINEAADQALVRAKNERKGKE